MVSVHAMKGTQMKKRSQMVSITNGAMIRIIGIDRTARKGTPAAARSNIYGNSMVELNSIGGWMFVGSDKMLVSTCARVLYSRLTGIDRHTQRNECSVKKMEVSVTHHAIHTSNQAIHSTHDTYVHDSHQQVWRNASRGILRKGEPLHSLLKHLPGIHEKCIVPAVTM